MLFATSTFCPNVYDNPVPIVRFTPSPIVKLLKSIVSPEELAYLSPAKPLEPEVPDEPS